MAGPGVVKAAQREAALRVERLGQQRFGIFGRVGAQLGQRQHAVTRRALSIRRQPHVVGIAGAQVDVTVAYGHFGVPPYSVYCILSTVQSLSTRFMSIARSRAAGRSCSSQLPHSREDCAPGMGASNVEMNSSVSRNRSSAC